MGQEDLEISPSRYDVPTSELLRTQIFWDAPLRHCIFPDVSIEPAASKIRVTQTPHRVTYQNTFILYSIPGRASTSIVLHIQSVPGGM
jgi:hypothetical protein